ncbi:hypothetical protein POSPLADRAFT_1130432, partial [Postia placenta MAD-698-R-SB12]
RLALIIQAENHISTLVRLDTGTLTACLRRTQAKHVADLLLGPRSHGPDDEETGSCRRMTILNPEVRKAKRSGMNSYNTTSNNGATPQAPTALRWETRQVMSEDPPNWEAIAYIHDTDFGRGTGISLPAAKDIAAERALKELKHAFSLEEQV